ncbi:hypothetical protein [Pyrinomonas sp.]|uniref:hypothetical protein n=1 Tax=Pyrinomonas sp. TaxID=2080306 RepID=UPI00331A823D
MRIDLENISMLSASALMHRARPTRGTSAAKIVVRTEVGNFRRRNFGTPLLRQMPVADNAPAALAARSVL